ncbi:MAG: hypothetical protein ABIJ91_01675 [Candidatus Kuenenbacteria bacterium]
MNKKILIPIIILLIITAGILGYFYLSQKPDDEKPAISTINPEELIIFEVKNEKISEYQKDQAFERFTSAKNTISKNQADNVAIEDNANYYPWLAIAGAQKVIGDYDRAAQIWIWFTDAYAGNSISPANLADLYKSFVIDKEKSEKYYLIAIEREKHDFQIYYGFYELYRYLFEDQDKAVQILEDGWQNNPDNRNYVVELVNYLISVDKKDKAGTVIDKWLETHPEDYSMKAKLE